MVGMYLKEEADMYRGMVGMSIKKLWGGGAGRGGGGGGGGSEGARMIELVWFNEYGKHKFQNQSTK